MNRLTRNPNARKWAALAVGLLAITALALAVRTAVAEVLGHGGDLVAALLALALWVFAAYRYTRALSRAHRREQHIRAYTEYLEWTEHQNRRGQR
ncbi:hypothetical protein [Amycolatopsis sp. CA-230715]|uniref:hypothetical protein n=1 Tax=Amycolatopsis sp. CA-230715 TaxID=2745196 RepID=UPI001C017614|nr:hypothetical protein [Amycolatopsis sp. CA-230715]QWF80455.1 hypothetical protein HUW46_03877 [Amycolatopsis sp. CA-230715]